MPKNNKKKNKKGGKGGKNKSSSQQQSSPVKPLGNHLKVYITMDSDWHIGSGGGIPGNIDSLVQRDELGIPGISAKTLTGVWRDACESVALGLDGGREGIWSQYVIYLFGDQPALNEDSIINNPPISAALKIRPARLHPDLKNAICDRPAVVKQALIKAMTMSKPGISIDPVSGCAVEGFLRQEEMVRAGTYLTSDCQLQLAGLSEEQKKAACGLLIAGTIYLEKLGGKRRRGAGQCKLDLAEVKDTAVWLDWIASNSQPANPLKNAFDNHSNAVTLEASSSNQHWYKIPLTITTQLPVIIKARTVGNIVETLDYIPGNRLLPIIARKLGKLGIDIVAAISQQQLVITNATVMVDSKAGRPVPLALFYEKMSGGFDKGRVYNQLMETPSADKQLKGYRQGYVGRLEGQQLPDYATVNTVIQTHNTIDDASQRPTEEVGGVYSYQAIEAGTVLQAELRLSKDAIATLQSNPKWWEKLKGKENIGTSKKDDYGLVEILPSEPTQIIAEDLITASDSEEHRLIVWLLSDVLIRDRQLRPSISLEDLQQTLSGILNRDLPEEQKVSLSLNSIYLRQRRTESWQKRWCLPRPSLTGLMAGSCIEFGIKTNADLGELDRRLSHLSTVGIGERTVEGYGQISFNDPLLNRETSNLVAMENSTPETSSNSVTKITTDQKKTFAYARVIETQAWRSAIATAAKALASNSNDRERVLGIIVSEGESHPSTSQLGNLRATIAKLREPKDIPLVINWIDSTEEKRAKKWSKTSDGLGKIKTLVESDRLIWSELANYTDIPLEDLTLTDNGSAYLGTQQWSDVLQAIDESTDSLRLVLWAEAIRTLVYECLHAHKREVE